MEKDEEYRLIELAKAGDLDASETLFLQWRPAMFSFCFKSKSRLSIDEKMSLAGEGFCKALKAFDTSKGFRFSTLLYKCVSQTLFKKQPKKTLFNDQLLGFDVTEDFSIDPEDSCCVVSDIVKSEASQRLHEAIDQLSSRHRFVIEQRMAGSNFHEIGAELNVTGERVRKIETEARAKIKFYFTRRRPTVSQPSKQDDLKSLLMKSINEVMDGNMSPAEAMAVSSLSSQLIKLKVIESQPPTVAGHVASTQPARLNHG